MHMPATLRQANLVGAFALEVVDRLRAAIVRDGERSFSTAAALIHVRLRPGESIGFLGGVLGISHPASVRLVDRLEREGLLDRLSGADGRSCALHLTSAGLAAAEEALQRRAHTLEEVLAPLSRSERQTFAALVGKLLAAGANERGRARHTCRLCDFPACARPCCPIDAALGDAGSIRVAPVAPVG